MSGGCLPGDVPAHVDGVGELAPRLVRHPGSGGLPSFLRPAVHVGRGLIAVGSVEFRLYF